MFPTQSLPSCLASYQARGSTFTLCMLFGVMRSVRSLSLRFSKRVQLQILQRDRRSIFLLPSDAELCTYYRVLAQKHSALGDVYAEVDGLKSCLKQVCNSFVQETFYSVWMKDQYVGNVLVFAPSGLIIVWSVNCPGAMHDSQICDFGVLCDRLGD